LFVIDVVPQKIVPAVETFGTNELRGTVNLSVIWVASIDVAKGGFVAATFVVEKGGLTADN